MPNLSKTETLCVNRIKLKVFLQESLKRFIVAAGGGSHVLNWNAQLNPSAHCWLAFATGKEPCWFWFLNLILSQPKRSEAVFAPDWLCLGFLEPWCFLVNQSVFPRVLKYSEQFKIGCPNLSRTSSMLVETGCQCARQSTHWSSWTAAVLFSWFMFGYVVCLSF